MTRTLMQPLAAEAGRHSRHFQLIVDIHLLLVSHGDLLLGRRANTGYGDGAYEPPSGRLAERETLVEAAVRVAAAQAGVTLALGEVSLAHVLHDVSGAGRMAFFLTADEWSREIGLMPGAAGSSSYSDFGWYPLTELPANMIDRARVAVRNYAAGGRFSTYPAFGMLIVQHATAVGSNAMRLVKTHGSLNEIFALEAAPDAWPSDAALRAFVRHVCDRSAWTGGSDGIYLHDPSGPDVQAWFFNPDGTSAEFCGNGMRGLGRLVLDQRGTDTEIVGSGGRDYKVHRAPSTPEGVRQVLLELPPLRFDEGDLPAPFGGFTAVAVPNPHVIAVVEEYSEPELIELGKRADEVFAEGANVSFLQPLAEGSVPEVFVRTFERGAGLTPSCGSGVVASRAAYSRVSGLDPGQRLIVRNAGGVAAASIQVRDGAWYPVLEGNATVVYRAEVDPQGRQTGAVESEADENSAYAALDEGNFAYLKTLNIVARHP